MGKTNTNDFVFKIIYYTEIPQKGTSWKVRVGLNGYVITVQVMDRSGRWVLNEDPDRRKQAIGQALTWWVDKADQSERKAQRYERASSQAMKILSDGLLDIVGVDKPTPPKVTS